MGYRVKSPDGELVFASLYDIERAYAHGLVDDDDEVLEDGSAVWRKASTLAALRHTRPQKSRGHARTLAVLFAVAGGSCALVLLVQGRWLPALGAALLSSLVASRVTYRAFKQKKP